MRMHVHPSPQCVLSVQVSKNMSTTNSRLGREPAPRDESRTRSCTVTPRINRSTYSRGGSVLHTAPAAAAPNSRQTTPANERALQTLPNTTDSTRTADSGPASGADTSEMSRQMNSIASEPGTANNSVQKELSLMHSTMPATLTSDAVPTTWNVNSSSHVPDLSNGVRQQPAAMHAHARQGSTPGTLPGEYIDSMAGANPEEAPGLNDTNAAMEYAGFDGGHSLYTIADASGLVTPPSGLMTPPGGFTPGASPHRGKTHERKLSTAPSSEESWVDMTTAGGMASRGSSGWHLQGQPWASQPGSGNGSIDDTPILPTAPSGGEGSLSPLGPNGMLPSAAQQEDIAVFHPSPGGQVTTARGPLDSDEHLRMHDEHRKQMSGGKDVLVDGRTMSSDSTTAHSGGTSSPSKGKGAAASLEETLGAAVEEAYQLLQEKKYTQAEAVLDGARTRYQRKRTMLERFDNSTKARVSGSDSGVTGRVAAAATVATGALCTPIRRSGSVGPSNMQTRIDARSKRGTSSSRGVSSTRDKGLKSPAAKSKPSPGRSTASGTLAPGPRGRAKQPAGSKGPVTTMHTTLSERRISTNTLQPGDIQSHPVGPYPSMMPSSAPVVVQKTLNSAVSFTAPSQIGPQSSGSRSAGDGDIELDMGSASDMGAGQVVSMANAARNGPSSLPVEVLSMSDTLAGASPPPRGPVSAADESAARVGDVVRVGKVRAVVRYVGPVKGLSRGAWVGLELSHPCGTGTGTINGIEYFACAASCGAFVALDKLMPDNDAYSTDI